ncbi:MAG: HAMP domain-containing methyl-accepting chemotaxis protein [Methanomicrobiales archaeon]|nr:HAMP domain-containing methyl-accepting chemotaxis protein [Methanomicrobiales archaeon]
MSFLDNIPLGKKLIGSFLVVVLIMIVVAWIGYSNMNTINTKDTEMYQDRLLPISQMSKIDSVLQILRADAYQYAYAPESRGEIDAALPSLYKDLEDKLASYSATALTSEEATELKKFNDNYPIVKRELTTFFAAAKANDKAAVDAALAKGSSLLTARAAAVEAVAAMDAINTREAKILSDNNDAFFANASLMMILATVVGIIIAMALAVILTRSITGPLAAVIAMMSDIGRGSLGTRLKMNRKDEIGALSGAMDQFAENFQNSILEPILVTSNELAKGDFTARISDQVKLEGDYIKFRTALANIGNQVSAAIKIVNEQVRELAGNAEEANASAEEITSGAATLAKSSGIVSGNAERSSTGMSQIMRAIDDLSKSVQEVATKTESISKLTGVANTLSKNGAELAQKAEHGMGSITKSAGDVEVIINEVKQQMEEIGKIVGLISDIADQTNMLALNAAIEAARAGDAGLGFAVVANEVKTLAQESQASAENIAGIIGRLQKSTERAASAMGQATSEVKAGGAAVSESLIVFNKIVRSVEEISGHMGEVAAASEEQAASVEEISASVSEVNSLVQGTAKEAMDSAAATEEASAAIDQVSKVINNVNVIIERLSREMSRFKV